MPSSRILTDSVHSCFLTRHFFRPQSRLLAIPRLCIPAKRAATSVTAPKTTQRTPLGSPAATLSLSPQFNVTPCFHQSLSQSRRLSHNGQNARIWEKPSFLPWSIIVLCGSCFAYGYWAKYQLRNQDNAAPYEGVIRNFTSSLTNWREGRWWTLLTPTIMHTLPVHLLINMAVLRDFGTAIVQLLGARAFVITWVGAGIFSSAASLLHETMKEKKAAKSKQDGFHSWDDDDKTAATTATTHQSSGAAGLGASGSLCGIFALLTCFAPQTKMQLMFIPIPIMGWKLLLGFAGFSLAAIEFNWVPFIGHDAHLGGMVFGVLYFVLLKGRRGMGFLG